MLSGVGVGRRYWAKKEMTKGPNKIILHPDDLVYMLKKDIGKGSKVCLRCWCSCCWQWW